MIFLFSATITYFFLKLSLPFLTNNFADLPNHRSSHNSLVPTGGGIGFVIVGIVGMALYGNYSALLCLPLAIVGFWDDKVSLNPIFRYFIQLLTVSLLFFASSSGIQLYGSISLFLFIPIYLCYLIAATAIINFINFMDGLDGLVGSSMAIIVAFFCFSVDNSLLPLLGALLGFLKLNWSPAKVFMGDGGSTFLGAILVWCILNTNSFEKSFAILLIATPLLLDASVCVIRRYFDGQRIFEAHSLHLFQRLHKAGWKHEMVTSLYLTFTALISLVYLIFNLTPALIMVALSLFFGIWLDKRYAIPFGD